MKRLFIWLLTVLFLASILFMGISCKVEEAAVAEEVEVEEAVAEEVEKEELAVERAAALEGEPITPTDFPADLLPGIDSPGVVPDKQYFIVYSNGDMNDLWRLNHVRDMEKFGNLYSERFGIKFMWANAGNNSAKQVSDIESLLSMKPDLLIFSPNEAEPLVAVHEMCNELGIPFVTVDRGIASEPGTGDMYKCSISMDFLYQGVAQGKMIVKYLTEKYGEPKGNVVELAGLAGSSPAIQRSQGINLVFKDYPDIRIIASKPTGFDRKQSYEIIQDWLETYPAGEIDAVAGSFDEGILGALQAIKEAGRDELIGEPLFGVDAIKNFLIGISEGECSYTVESPPFYGMLGFEYGIRFLMGEELPPYIMLPMRSYWSGNEVEALLQEHIDYLVENNMDFVPLEVGGQSGLYVDVSDIYPTSWIEDSSLLDLPYYQTEEPIE